jgi:Fe-S cluster biogenesis protein NfuA
VEEALARVRPFLATHAGNVELLGIDADAGSVRLRLLGSCDGCPSSAVTLQMAVERSILEAAPEIALIEVEEPSRAMAMAASPIAGEGASGSSHGQSVPIALRVKPTYASCPAEVSSG